jgi:hypothetical protein
VGVADLLLGLGTLESCEARVPTAHEQDIGEVPDWCELVLTLERDDKTVVHYLRRHDGELIVEILNDVLRPHTGASGQQMIWAELDEVYDRMKRGEPEKGDKDYARGLCMALAIIRRIGAPDLDAIRETARERWRAAHRGDA